MELVALTNFLHEVGQLRRTERTGYPFLGNGHENVAEHSHRTAVIGYALARRAGANAERTALLCLFHDLGEARTGDLNYVGKQYVQRDERRALVDATTGTGLEGDVLGMWDELEAEQSLEAKLAHDADQLDLLLNLKRELDLGNKYAQQWIDNLVPRLGTELGKELAATIVRVDHTDWWFADKDPSCWARKVAPKADEF